MSGQAGQPSARLSRPAGADTLIGVVETTSPSQPYKGPNGESIPSLLRLAGLGPTGHLDINLNVFIYKKFVPQSKIDRLRHIRFSADCVEEAGPNRSVPPTINKIRILWKASISAVVISGQVRAIVTKTPVAGISALRLGRAVTRTSRCRERPV